MLQKLSSLFSVPANQLVVATSVNAAQSNDPVYYRLKIYSFLGPNLRKSLIGFNKFSVVFIKKMIDLLDFLYVFLPSWIGVGSGPTSLRENVLFEVDAISARSSIKTKILISSDPSWKSSLVIVSTPR